MRKLEKEVIYCISQELRACSK